MANIQVKEYVWSELKHMYEKIYESNQTLSVYQSWDYLNFTGKGFTLRNLKGMIGLRERNFVLFQNEEPIAIAPLLVRNKNIYIRGMFTGAGELGFVYADSLTYENFVSFIEEMEKTLGKSCWCIDRVSEKSKLYDYWCRYAQCQKNVHMDKEICVEISVPEDYDSWYKGLSHSVRQNIRTSYNRIKKDGKDFSYELFVDKKIPNEVFKQILSVASRRALEYDRRKGKLLYCIYYVLKSADPMLRFLRYCRYCTYGVVHIDGELAASFIALRHRDGRLVVPRLSYNSKFYRYSPGGILVNETMKHLCADELFADISSFDLSRGEEKYKYDYGGKEHYNYGFHIEP